MRVVGIVINLNGNYFAKDEQGHIRQLKVGDKIYEGEVIYGGGKSDALVIESPQSNEKIMLHGLNEYVAQEFGYAPKLSQTEHATQDIKVDQIDQGTQESHKTIAHSHSISQLSSYQAATDNAVGFQEVFSVRDGNVVNVIASLLDTSSSDTNIDTVVDSDLPFNPPPSLTTNISEVEDNFYDTYLPSGTNTVNNSFTYQALSGFKTVTIGTRTFTQSEVEAFGSSPVTLKMAAGELTLNGYSKVNDDVIISYTYKTSHNYLHAADSDLFIDSLDIVVKDVGDQSATSVLRIDVIDDTPITQADGNEMEVGKLVDDVNGNVFSNDHIGADDETKLEPVVSVVSSIGSDEDGSENIGKVLSGEYGSLVLNADGTYAYTLDETNPAVVSLPKDATLEETFTYTIEDGDHDKSTNKLTITIDGTSSPTVSIEDGTVEDNFYDSYQASGTNEVNDTINISLGGDIQSVKIGDAQFTLSDLEALNTTPVKITMNAGELTLNSYTHSGDSYTIGYNYATSDNYLHDVNSDNFIDKIAVVVTDGAGRDAQTDLNINVTDDAPITNDDTNEITEGLVLNQIKGNVFLGDTQGGVADHIGADNENESVPVIDVSSITADVNGSVGSGFDGKYGELILKADGSYKYILDNTNPEVKALVDGETLNDVFSYTIVDADGDKANAELNITIDGNSEDPVLVVADGVVDEAALNSDGTNPLSDNEVVTGTITGTANDGFQDLKFTISDDNTLTIDDLSSIDGSQTINTPYGTLTLVSYSETPAFPGSGAKVGQIAYSYELTTPVSNATLSDSFDDILKIELSDVNGDTTTKNLTITINDDKPLATDDANSVTEDSSDIVQATGNVLTNDVDGADTNTNPITAQDVAGKYGEFVLGTDGNYTYTLDNDNPAVNALKNGETLTDTLEYTITDGDGDSTTANLDITINGFTDPNLSVDDVTVVEDGTSGDMQVVFTINMDTTSPRDVTFDYSTLDGSGVAGKEYSALGGTATITAGSTSTTVTVTLGADDYVADSGKTFDLKITNVNSAGAILDATGTATITDDSLADTPYNHTDTIEYSQEGVTLKLVATDESGKILDDPSANSTVEGEKAYYKVVVQDADGNDAVDADDKLASGTVNIAYADDTATGGVDYDNSSVKTVNVNQVFSVDTIDDWISDDGETFKVSVADDQSYSNAKDFENVTQDTTAVTTTINDDSDVTILNLSGDTTVPEGNNASYTLSVDHAPQSDLSVTVALTNVDTEDGDFDFTTDEKTQTVVIAAGTTSSTFQIDTVDDSVYECNENYKIAITGTSGGGLENLQLGSSEVTTTITDNDVPHITVDDVTILEDGTATITVTSDITAKEDMVFEYTLSAGTATSGVDFTPKTGSVIIAAGDTTGTIALDTPIDDYFADNLETYNVSLSATDSTIVFDKNVSVVTIDDNTGATTIENNEDPLTLKLVAVDNTGAELGQDNSANEGAALFYKVKSVDKDGHDVLDSDGNLASGTVDIAYTDKEATGGDDYINTLTTVNVNEVFSVATLKDSISDDDEKFDVALNGNYSKADDYETVVYDTATVTSTINDDTSTKDIVYIYMSQDAVVSEADGAALTHTLTFKKADGTPIDLADGKQVTVNLTYSNDATDAADFQTKMTQVIITGDGTSSYTFSNIVADDFLKEGSESYTLQIASASDDDSYFEALLPIGFGKVTGTINDETPPDEVFVSIHSDQTIREGDNSGEFIVAVDRPTSEVTSDITVALTYSGTAIDGTDYKGVSEVTIPAGSNSTIFDITTIQDKVIEGSEDFTITIGTITDTNFEAISADSTADSVTNTIIDDVDANPDTNALKEGGNQVIGNLLINDEVGVNGKVTSFKYFDESGKEQNGTIGEEADTQYGRITVQANGSYVYYSDTTPENHPSDGNTDTAILPDIINYTVVDDNGDSDSSTLTVNVGDTIGSVIDGSASSVDENDLPSGSDTTKESLIITNNDLGIQPSTDGVASVGFDLGEVQAALDLQSHGVALTYTLRGTDNNILSAKADDTEVFVVTINKNGGADASYNFELKAPLDHLNSSGGKLDSLDIKIPFEYKEIGATEDTVKGNLTVNVIDDTPTAVVDDAATVEEGDTTPITGNVLTNDIQGADGALLHDFKYTDISGSLQDKYFSDTVSTYTVDTPTGSLTVNQDGSWSFAAHTYVDHDDVIQGDAPFSHDGSDNDSTKGSFDYRLQDYDTDNSNYVTQIIHVTDGANPSSSDVTNAVDEDDIAGSGSDQTQSATVTGTLDVTGGSDPIDVGFTTTGSGTLTANGVAITYTLSNSGHTLTGTAGSDVIFIAQVTGDTTVNNPSYSFELKGAIDHPDASGENTLDLPLEFKALDIDGDAATGNLTIIITDDIPSIATPVDGAVDESGLPYGATPDESLTVTTGTLAVGQEADAIDTVFNAATITALESQNLQATVGNPLSYTISNAGHTLTATQGDVTYFSVDIKNPTDATASYEFNLINAIHEPTSGGTQNINIPFSVSDFDKDTTSSSFNVVVTDDIGSTDKQLTLNEDGSITFSVTADAIEPQADYITEHGRISFDDATNLFTYTPDADYSGVDNGIVLDYVVNGVSHSVNVDATINPVSDKPTLSEDATTVNTDEDTVVALGFNVPLVTDDFDQNSLDTAPNSTSGDNPERLGAITLSGLPNGAKLGFGSTVVDLDGSDVTLQISDLDNNDDGVNDYLAGLTTDYTLTKAEFESMKVLPPLNSGENFDVTMKVTSYEVDDSGAIISGVAGAESTQSVTVDVHAKTDDGVGISVTNINGNEDEWMRIDDHITITKTADTDGSEVYELVFDGANLPDGTLYYTGSTPVDMSDRSIGTDASGGFSISIADIDNLPEMYIMTPVNDSTDIKDLKVTVNVHDTDSDSTPATDVVKSASDFVDATVLPIANDITVTTTGSVGDEDTKIPLNLSFTNEDGPLSTPAGLEKVTSVTITGIPSDAKLFDENGQEVAVSNGSVTVDIVGGDTSKIDQYTMQPPAHSSKDITLQVSMTTKDEDDNDGDLHTDTSTTTPIDVVVKVNPVSETDTSDTAAPKGDDITPVSAHTYTTLAEEDTYFDLNNADADYKLEAANEDALVNEDGTTNPYGSEETFVVFTNARYFDGANEIAVSGDTFLKYNNGSSDVTMKFSGTGEVRVPLEFLDTVEIKAAQDFSGTFKVDTYVQNQDLGEDPSDSPGSIENSTVSTLVINVNPVPEVNPSVSISNLSGVEDAGRYADGTIDALSAIKGIPLNGVLKTSDSDGSETFTITLDKIPEDAAIYVKGHIVYANSSSDFSSDGIISTDNGDGTFKVDIQDIDPVTPPFLIPPHNSNEDITLQVSGQIVDTTTLEDGTVITVPGDVSDPVAITVVIKGVADSVVNNEFKTYDVAVDTQQANGDKFDVTERYDGGGAYNAVVAEDSDASGKGVLIDLQDIYKDPSQLNSYDNLDSNAVDVSPVADTSVATETVNLTVTGLDEQFDLQGAVLVNGTGSDRVYTFTLAELQSGNIKVVVPEHYSGEVDFKVQYVTTENDGDSKTSLFDDVKILVTPKAEDTSAIAIDTLDVNEDTLTPIAFNLTNPAVDDNGNPETLYEVWIKVSDVESKEFTLFDGTDYTTLENAVSSNANISKETIDGDDYYKLENGAFNNLYVQYNPDLGTTTDTSFETKYTFMDYIDADGKTLENISPQETTTYTMNLSPITDDIDAQGTSITDSDDDGTTDISNVNLDLNGDGTQDDMSVKVLSDTQLSVDIHIDGVNMLDEVDPATGNKPNGIDADASEQIQSIRIDGVPKGVGIEGGRYAGDIEDPDHPGVYTGIWYIDNPKDSDDNAMSIDADGTDYNLVLNILSPFAYGDAKYTGHEVGGDIKVSFINVDGTASAVNDAVNIHIDDTDYNPSTPTEVPIDILEWNSTDKGDVIVEDTPTKLGDLINFAIDDSKVGNNPNATYNGVSGIDDGKDVTYKRFSITVEGFENATVSGWQEDSSSGTTFWTYQGAVGETDIQAALDKLIITPDLDYNKNHDRAQGDTENVFDEGALKFTATLTTYTQSGFSDDVSLDYVGNVQPVTDDITLDTTFDFIDEYGTTHSSTIANEDGTFNIDIAIDSVDNPYLSVQSDYTITNISPDNIGVIVADGSDEQLNGQISWDNGATWHDLNVGDSVSVPKADIDNVVFKLNKDIAGHVKLTYSVDVLEKDDTGAAKTVGGDVAFDVNSVADGLASSGDVKIVGDEDTFIELTDSSGNSFNTLSSDDPTEEVTSLMLSGVPVGYLVYVGADGSQVLADNLGVDASGNNSWAIDASDSIPKIWLKAPEDVGGITSTPTAGWDLLDSIKLVTGVDDMGTIIFSTQDVQLQINAVADDLQSVNAEDIKGVEGEDIDFIFNALVKDTDGSESLKVTLQGLGNYAVFKLSGVELDSSVVSYDVGNDIYTIDSLAVDYNSIKQLSVMQNDFSGDVTVGLSTVEKSNADTSAVTSDTFTMTITQQPHSAADDILLFDLKGTEGGSGDDTLLFGTDWNNTGIDFTALDDTLTKNVERLDLTEHGDHTITLNSTDVEAMTDARDALTIESDTGDTINIQNKGDNVWAQEGATNVYEDVNGATLTFKGDGVIDESGISATADDDVLGYNDTNAIDGGAGNDRIIIFDSVSVDFAKLSNIETIDLSVKGDHDLGTLSLSDVINSTDTNNTLTIEGNDINDKVSFSSSDGWEKGSSDGTYTSYTNTNDSTVLVKVNDNIDDQII